MAEAQTPETEKPQFTIDSDATAEAVTLLTAAQDNIRKEADLQERALTAYSLHPKAAMAVLALVQEDPAGLDAIQRWHEVFTSDADIHVEFEPSVEKELRDDPKHKELIKEVQQAKGDEKVETARFKVRASRMGRFINVARDATSKDDTTANPEQNSAA